MNVKKARVSLIFVLLVASIIPMIQAPSDTASPSQSNDDAMRTGIGAYFGDTAFLTLKDEVVDIVTGIRFRGVDVPQGAKINNATLYVRSVYAYPIGEAYVTLTGDDADNSLAFNDSGSFNRIYTNAFKVWNVSDVFGTVIANVSITEIVQEIIDRPGWTDGNSLSLIMFSESGTPRREFVSWDGNWEDPWIEVWYNEELTQEEIEEDIQDQAPAPFNDTDTFKWEKNDTYRGIDIYIVTEMGDPEMIITQPNGYWFYNTSWGTLTAKAWFAGGGGFQSGGGAEIFAFLGDWMFFIGRNNSEDQTFVYWSDDAFDTWQTVNLHDVFPYISGESGYEGAIWADQNGSSALHIVWASQTSEEPAATQILYANFTLDPVTWNITFGAYANVTVSHTSNQENPDLYQEKDGTIHVAWTGRNGTANAVAQYRRRQANGTWLDQVRLSSDDIFDAVDVDVVANEVTGLGMVTWTKLAVGDWSMRWDVVFPNNTVGTPVGIGADRGRTDRRYISVVNERANNVAHLSVQRDSTNDIYYHYKPIDNVTNYDVGTRISLGGDRVNYNVIGLDEENETLAVVFFNFDTLNTQWNYWYTGTGPTARNINLITTNFIQYPHSTDYFELATLSVSIWLVYPNGTLVSPDPLPDGVDPEDAIDDLLGGAQPEDPQPDEYPIIGKFTWKLLVLAVGMIMLLGSPIAGTYYGADTATWIKILFIMFFGIGILWQIKSM